MSGTRAIDGGKPAPALGQFSWTLYEAAQGPYFVTLTIVVFAPFFAQGLVGDATRGQALWGYVQGTAGLLVALISPFLGSLADAAGPRKPGLALAVVIASVGMGCLWFAAPGAPYAVLIGGGLIIVCAILMEVASVYHNALLPSIVSPARVGLLSGVGYGLQYVGSIGTLVLWLVFFSWPETPLFDLDRDRFEVERIIGPLVAIWTVLFTLPLLLFTPDRPRTGLGARAAIRRGTANLIETFRHLGRYRNIALFLLARTIYYDGVLVTFAFLGIYGGGIFGWSVQAITVYGAIALVMSAIGGVLGGFVDDRIGSKRTILISLLMFLIGLLGVLGTTPETILFLPLPADAADRSVPVLGAFWTELGYDSYAEQVFVTVTFIMVIFAGPVLAASRTMLARIAPPDMAAQFFGLYTLTGKATAFSAPFAIGALTDVTESQRLGLSVILLYLIIGGAGMLFVREKQAASHR